MSIQTELTRLTNAKAAIQAAIEGKGVTVPSGTLLDGMASLIEAIEAGGVDKLATGSISPAEITGELTITHNLGAKPNLFFMLVPASYTGASENIASCMQHFLYGQKAASYTANISLCKGTNATVAYYNNSICFYRLSIFQVKEGSSASSSIGVILLGDNELTIFAPTASGYPQFYTSTYYWVAAIINSKEYWR